MELQPIKTKRIYETIVDQIKSLIVSGNLSPGDKLLSERELSEKLQVSRTCVREALCALDVAGLIEVRPGEGAFVRQSNANDIIESLAFAFLLEKDKIRDLMEVRKGLEVESAGLAAERASEENIKKMEAALAQMEDDLRTGSTGEKADLMFHNSIAEATCNPLLIRMMTTIYDTMNQTLQFTRKLWISSTSGTPSRLYEEHREIFEAIKAGNSQKARKIMADHLHKVVAEMERINRLEKEQEKN